MSYSLMNLNKFNSGQQSIFSIHTVLEKNGNFPIFCNFHCATFCSFVYNKTTQSSSRGGRTSSSFPSFFHIIVKLLNIQFFCIFGGEDIVLMLSLYPNLLKWMQMLCVGSFFESEGELQSGEV